eukprot:TRINITY_DN21253_c0_g1_i1.p1 TRINITY_DN21253_c0_g1~~TRINITY_DN21253_c0_g1_i1.p1  ORF type:complete len:728 (+),score=205.04 TRINITY_DN21253_c0_g1_i1:43-2226(+)
MRLAVGLAALVLTAAPAGAVARRRPTYTGCPAGRYGGACEGQCRCDPTLYDCDDGPSGDGACLCRVGAEAACGEAVAHPPACTPALEGTLACVEVDVGYYDTLPADEGAGRGVRQVMGAARVAVRPHPLHRPLVVAASDPEALEEVGLTGDADVLALMGTARPEEVIHTRTPYAHSYGGIQFGRWAGQLGDGRCVSVGHLRGSRGGTPTQAELQLKGSGRTPFSRSGDGRAALANSVREFLAGAALEAQAIPATHAPALIGSGSDIIRDELYTGTAEYVRAGVLLRTAPNFLRFGSVQLAQQRLGDGAVAAMLRLAARGMRQQEAEGLARPADLSLLHAAQVDADRDDCFFAANRTDADPCLHAAALLDHDAPFSGADAACVLARLVRRFAALAAAWQAAGFAHGVLNTDNMGLAGVTIDLNVYGWISAWDRDWAPNHIDTDGRYAFGRQAEIVHWNLQRLADALTAQGPLHDGKAGSGQAVLQKARAEEVLAEFPGRYRQCFAARMHRRLGLVAGAAPEGAEDDDGGTCTKPPSLYDEPHPRDAWLVSGLLDWLREFGGDYHIAMQRVAAFAKAEDAYASDGACEDVMAQHAAELGGMVRDIVAASRAAPPGAAAEALIVWLKQYSEARCAERLQYAATDADAWRAAFAAQTDAANPSYVPRTPALRDLARRAPHNRAEIEAVLRLLRAQPDAASLVGDVEREWAPRLRDVPDDGGRRAQTSCGAQ